MSVGRVLGAPKVINLEASSGPRLSEVRMDTCAFVGVAPKGPARRPRLEDSQCFSLSELHQNWDNQSRTVATLINSWDEYVSLFSGFEGPGRLPYAVAKFFEQGGRRAYVSRIVPAYPGDINYLDYLAWAEIDTLSDGGIPFKVTAKNEGSWANGIRVAVGLNFQSLLLQAGSDTLTLKLSLDVDLPLGSLLRLVNNDPDHSGDNFVAYRFVESFRQNGEPTSDITLNHIDVSHNPLPAQPTLVQLVTGQWAAENSSRELLESFDGLGLSPAHPNFIGKVLFVQSNVVDPHKDTLLATYLPPDIEPYVTDFFPYQSQQLLMTGPAILDEGKDNYQDISHNDFFDPGWGLADEVAGDGIHSLALKKDCAMLVVPDLYVPEVFERTPVNEPHVPSRRAEFAPCIQYEPEDLQLESIALGLPMLMLDPVLDLDAIIGLQKRVLEFVQQTNEMVLLTDVPPRLNPRQVLNWRSHFNSRLCAAYHPWLKVNRVNPYDLLSKQLVEVNPSAIAAGIIAAKELNQGLAHGPANVLVQGVTALDVQVSESQHDEFHPMGINVLHQQRDGIWLTGARTVSSEKQWRQLSVVRLIMMLKKSLERHMQWLVFEPNTASLWAEVTFSLRTFLRQMFLAGAFRGETEQQAYFIRCDETTNPPQIVDAGRMVAIVGVALVEPLEFILLQITRQVDGQLSLEVQ